MSPQVEEVLKAALALPDSERLALVNQLLDTLPAELFDEESWVAELERRASEKDQFIPWNEVRKQIWPSRD